MTDKPDITEFWESTLFWDVSGGASKQATVNLQRNVLVFPQGFGLEKSTTYTTASIRNHERNFYGLATDYMIVF